MLFVEYLGKERLEWLDELAPLASALARRRKLKLLYPEETRDDDGQPNSAGIAGQTARMFRA